MLLEPGVRRPYEHGLQVVDVLLNTLRRMPIRPMHRNVLRVTPMQFSPLLACEDVVIKVVEICEISRDSGLFLLTLLRLLTRPAPKRPQTTHDRHHTHTHALDHRPHRLPPED